MLEDVLDNLYKIQASNLTKKEVLQEIHRQEKEGIESLNKKYSPVDVCALLCLRDLKEEVFLSKGKITTYSFRKKIDNIKSLRDIVKISHSYNPISINDLENILEYIEAGIECSCDEINKVFCDLKNIIISSQTVDFF